MPSIYFVLQEKRIVFVLDRSLLMTLMEKFFNCAYMQTTLIQSCLAFFLNQVKHFTFVHVVMIEIMDVGVSFLVSFWKRFFFHSLVYSWKVKWQSHSIKLHEHILWYYMINMKTFMNVCKRNWLVFQSAWLLNTYVIQTFVHFIKHEKICSKNIIESNKSNLQKLVSYNHIIASGCTKIWMR